MDTNGTIEGHRITNGVDVTALDGLSAAVAAKPALGAFRFRADNRWLGAASTAPPSRLLRRRLRGRDAQITTNSTTTSRPLLGGDRNANPVEYLLHALAGC
jgi:hypothetical protein